MYLFKTISATNSSELPMLWRLAESYLHVGQRSYKVKSLNQREVNIEEEKGQTNHLTTALKIASYLTVIPLILSMIIKTAYHLSYSIKWTDHTPEYLNYNMDHVIDRIREAKNNHLHAALFVGRDNSQRIPNEEGWAWFTLDSLMIDNPETIRNHLKLDFNQEESLQKINQLFDKVVVDISVLKFMHRPWKTVHQMLDPKKESMLITETWSKVSYYKQLPDSILFNFEPENATMAESIDEIENSPNSESRILGLIESIRRVLQKRFEEVKLIKNQSFPYRTGNEEIIVDFWELRSPKIVT